MTIPACLPITTDYFPDKRALNNDYVLSIYTLLPDDVNADFMRLRAVQRKPLSTEEVFRELVSQRLSQVGSIDIISINFSKKKSISTGLSTNYPPRACIHSQQTTSCTLLWWHHSTKIITCRSTCH